MPRKTLYRTTTCGACKHSCRERLRDAWMAGWEAFGKSSWDDKFGTVRIPDAGDYLICPKCGCLGDPEIWLKEE